jgi:hypothetical protein
VGERRGGRGGELQARPGARGGLDHPGHHHLKAAPTRRRRPGEGPAQATDGGRLEDHTAHRQVVERDARRGPLQGLVQRQRKARRRLQLLERRDPGLAQRLLERLDRQRVQCVDHPGRVVPGPGAVGVEPQGDPGRQLGGEIRQAPALDLGRR